jgi:hypothetical protein
MHKPNLRPSPIKGTHQAQNTVPESTIGACAITSVLGPTDTAIPDQPKVTLDKLTEKVVLSSASL